MFSSSDYQEEIDEIKNELRQNEIEHYEQNVSSKESSEAVCFLESYFIT